MSVHLMGVHPTGVYLMGMYLTGVYLTGVYLTGVYLMSMHRIARAQSGITLSSLSPHPRHAALTLPRRKQDDGG